MLHRKSITVAALSALVTVSTVGATAQQSPVPQEGVEQPQLSNMAPPATAPAKNPALIKIDASSSERFKESLETIREALPEGEEKKLDKAIEILAEKGDKSLTEKVQDAVTSDEDIVYEKHGLQLNGKTYTAILQLAG